MTWIIGAQSTVRIAECDSLWADLVERALTGGVKVQQTARKEA